MKLKTVALRTNISIYHLPCTFVRWPMSLAHIDLGIDYVILAAGLIIHSATMSIVWWSYKFDGERGCFGL